MSRSMQDLTKKCDEFAVSSDVAKGRGLQSRLDPVRPECVEDAKCRSRCQQARGCININSDVADDDRE